MRPLLVCAVLLAMVRLSADAPRIVIDRVSPPALVVDLPEVAKGPGNHLVNVSRPRGETAWFVGGYGDSQDTFAWLLRSLRPDAPCFDNTSRYVNCGNGTVTDEFSGLVWLLRADCLPASTWPDAQRRVAALNNGECGLTDRSLAGDWRLPTDGEWAAMIALARSMNCVATAGPPALTNDPGTLCYAQEPASFTGVSASSTYWSSTSDTLASRARFIDLTAAKSGVTAKTAMAGVWPVRGLAR